MPLWRTTGSSTPGVWLLEGTAAACHKPSLHASKVRSWLPATGMELFGLSTQLGWWVLYTHPEHGPELTAGHPWTSLPASICTHRNVDLDTVGAV